MRSHAARLKSYGQPAYQMRVVGVGGEIMILAGTYDPDQEWFEFMLGTVVEEPRERTAKQKQADAALIEKKKLLAWTRYANPFMTIDDRYRHMHAYDTPEDVDQPILPFLGHMRLGNKEFTQFQRRDLPGFERLKSDGGPKRSKGSKVARFQFKPADRDALIEWCAENCSAFYNITTNVATFASLNEAFAARMIFDPGRG